MMKLYLVQHGEALAKETDPARPLTDSGRAAVRRIADQLAGGGCRVGTVVHSGKTRAEQSAALLADCLAPDIAIEQRNGLDPNDPVAPLVSEAATWSEDAMLVGHLPFMAKLAAALVTGDESSDLVGFTPGTVLCLERGETHGWRIAWMLRPELVTQRADAPRDER